MPLISSATPARVILAAVAYGEARAGGSDAMADVLSVVMNRARAGWQTSPGAVCLAPRQFSCLNADDPNLRTITALRMDDPLFETALAVADLALSGGLEDRTGGADSYFAVSIRAPYWAHPPARHTVTRWLHSFWVVEPRLTRIASVPCLSVHPTLADELAADALTVDVLNDAELTAVERGAP